MGKKRLLSLNELKEIRFGPCESVNIYKKKTKASHDELILKHEFHVGDQVLVFNSKIKLFLGILKSRWTRPYTITKVFTCGSVEVIGDGCIFKVNGNRVKHYVRVGDFMVSWIL